MMAQYNISSELASLTVNPKGSSVIPAAFANKYALRTSQCLQTKTSATLYIGCKCGVIHSHSIIKLITKNRTWYHICDSDNVSHIPQILHMIPLCIVQRPISIYMPW